MKCPKCSAEFAIEAKFCSNCGSKIESGKDVNIEPTKDVQQAESHVENSQTVYKQNEEQQNEDNSVLYSDEYHERVNDSKDLKDKIHDFWNGLDQFCKIEIIALIVICFLLFSALCRSKIISVILSIIQLMGLGGAFLLHKGIIKCNLKWIKHAILIVAIVITGINCSSLSWSSRTIVPKVEISKSVTPYSAQECGGKDNDNVKNDFFNSGFHNIEENVIEDLDISEADKCGIVESVSINGVHDFIGNTEFNSSSKVIINYHDFKKLVVPFSSDEIKYMDSELILKAIEDAGFLQISTDEKYDLDPDEEDAEYENIVEIDGEKSFKKGDEFSPDVRIKLVTHRPFEKYTLKVIIDFIPNLFFSTYDVEFTIDDYSENLTHGNDAEFEYRLKKGKYTLEFTSKESSSVNGTIDLTLNGDTEACYKISCTEEKVRIDTQYVENKDAVGENQAMVPYSASNCKYKDYKDIKTAFKKAGFTNIKKKILYDIYWGWTDEGEVDSVTIGSKTDFNRGDIFEKDVSVVITYHMSADKDPDKVKETTTDKVTKKDPQTVSYSSNDFDTAKKGNTGVFAYRMKGTQNVAGGWYDQYYIIDFDEGYVYYFCEGYESEKDAHGTCERVKIESGTLNDVVIITYHDGGYVWSYGLHFKYKNQPVTLIMEDDDGVEYKFSDTNLKKALELRAKKTVHDY